MTYETDASGTLLSVSFDSQKIQNYYPTFSVGLNQQSLTITFDRSQIGPFPDYLYLSFYEEGQVYIAERAFNSSGTYDYSFGLVSLSPQQKGNHTDLYARYSSGMVYPGMDNAFADI